MSHETDGPVKARYRKLQSDRDAYVDRAKRCAKLTIPSVFPENPEAGGNAPLPTTYQGLGARGVNTLSSKLALALFPPNSPFFRLSLSDNDLRALGARRARVEKTLGSIERDAVADLEASGARMQLTEAFKLLIVTGNALLFLPETGARVYRLDRYVVVRDPLGNVTEIITLDAVTPDLLPAQALALLEKKDGADTKPVEVYTHIRREPTRWTVSQEINGHKVPGASGHYPLDASAWIPLRFVALAGEHYGRSYVEEFLGDLTSYEALSKAIVEGAAAAAKVLFFVKPGSVTSAATIAEAPNCAVRIGDSADVSTLQLDKFADFRVALEQLQNLERRLSMAFMLTSAVQRNGERVTAEEVRIMAGDLEDALGGLYSVLTQELQLPIVNRHLARMQRARKIPAFPKGVVRPQIVTGLEALGRGHDLAKLRELLAYIKELGPEVVRDYVKVADFIERVGTALGIDMDGLVPTDEELKKMAQDKQAMEAMGALMPMLQTLMQQRQQEAK